MCTINELIPIFQTRYRTLTWIGVILISSFKLLLACCTRLVSKAIFGAYTNRAMDVLTRPAEEFGNDETLEHLWAARAMEHSDIYFNVLCSVDTRWLRLTPHDDLIFTHFKQDFPDLNVSLIKENEIKNSVNKVKWRMYCEKFKNIVEDYSFGTLLRADTTGDYSEQNTILVPRVQFYAIEIARNREGLNNEVKKKYKCASKANMEAQRQSEIAA